MSFNYLTNSSGFTRITAYVGKLLDGAVDEHIERLSQQLRPDPASKGLQSPVRTERAYVADDRSLGTRQPWLHKGKVTRLSKS